MWAELVSLPEGDLPARIEALQRYWAAYNGKATATVGAAQRDVCPPGGTLAPISHESDKGTTSRQAGPLLVN